MFSAQGCISLLPGVARDTVLVTSVLGGRSLLTRWCPCATRVGGAGALISAADQYMYTRVVGDRKPKRCRELALRNTAKRHIIANIKMKKGWGLP